MHLSDNRACANYRTTFAGGRLFDSIEPHQTTGPSEKEIRPLADP